MGCDIHIYCEYRNKATDMKWFNCDWYKRNLYYKKFDDNYIEPKWECIHAYDGRDYILFGILAGVRNKSNPIISEPRGIPNDIHKQTKKEYNNAIKCMVYHSFSWLTIEELINYRDKYNKVEISGYISSEDAYKLDINGIKPNEWCKYTNINDWVFRKWDSNTSDYIDGLLNCLYKRFDSVFHVYDFYTDAEKDQKRREYAKDARIIFWFDS